MEQMIIGLIIIALGMVLFHYFPFERGNIKKLTLSAIFIVITLICKRFLTFTIPLFGLETLKIGLEYIPLMVGGYCLSPSYAFVVGLCCDLIGLILVPTGFPFFGFTLTMILVCVIPSFIRHFSTKINEGILNQIVMVFIIVLSVVSSLFIYHMDSVTISSTVVTLEFGHKFILISMCLLLSVVVCGVIIYVRKRNADASIKILASWVLSVVLVEGFVTLILSPLWLEIMYDIPFVVSFCIRVVKECFVIPLEIIAGYTIIKLIYRVILR